VQPRRARPTGHADPAPRQADILGAAYALALGTPNIPCSSPKIRPKCFEMGAQAFDLADRLQTTILRHAGTWISAMNEWLCRPVRVGRQAQARSRQGHDLRGGWRAGADFGRYKDVDGDGIPLPHLSGRPP